MIISKEKAIQIALENITRGGTILQDNPPMVIKEKIREFKWGWLIFYDSKISIETSDFEKAYIGNVPIFVDKFDGALTYMNDFLKDFEELIEEYRLNKGYSK